MVLTTFICMHYRPQTGLPPPCDWDPDSLPGEAEFASGWPAALAGSLPWVPELPGNVWGGVRSPQCTRDGVLEERKHMPHGVLGRPEFGSGVPARPWG